MQTQVSTGNSAGLISLSKWAEQVGITAITAWRYRKRGWLQTVNICGRVYLTPEAIAAFTRRAESGEFAQEHKAPGRRDTTSMNALAVVSGGAR